MTSSVQDDAGQSRAGLRASDADREAVVRTLHDAFTRGLLTMEECDERMAAAYAARLLRDLPPLTADLPPAPAAAPTAPGWRALAVLAWLQLRAAVAGFSWRGSARSIRARPRLALAAVALLALLSVAAVSGGNGVDHGFDHRGPDFHNEWHFRPH
jgi:Domain of unknown function (DUF1707)